LKKERDNKKNDSDKGDNKKTNNKNKGPNGMPKEQQWRPKKNDSMTLPEITEAPKEKEQEISQPPSQKSQESQHKNRIRVGVEPMAEKTGEMHSPTETDETSTGDSPM
jgi:hypothetical protein